MVQHTNEHSVTPVLDVQGLSKTFAGQQVLFDVDLSIAPGEVHALVGQNGSGKSTLVKILAGYHRPDPGGTASVSGSQLPLGESGSSHAAGIRFVHQDLGLVPTISTVDNLALGSGFETGCLGRILWRHETRRAQNALRALGFDVDVLAPVSTLSLAERTGVAIARALGDQESERLLVLDEPTAALPLGEAARLYGIIRRLRDRGTSVLLITHHLGEVLDIADRVSVLRNGRRVATVRHSELDPSRLAEWIVGRELLHHEHTDTMARDEDQARMLQVSNVRGSAVLTLSLTVASGEIVGIAGLSGSGRESVASLLAGRLPRSGEVRIAGDRLRAGDPRAAKNAGMALVPGDRGAFGTVSTMTVRENLTLGELRRHTRWGRTSSRSERSEVSEWIDRLAVVTPGTEAPISNLSGGNQQKVLFARALRLKPRVLVLDDPTAGVDVGAKLEVHTIVEQAARDGAAVVLATTDTDELVSLCDRVLVMRHGSVADVISRSEGFDAARIDHAQLA